MQHMHERIVQPGSRQQAIEEHRHHVARRGRRRQARQRQHEQRDGEQRHGCQAGRVEAACAPDVDCAGQDAAEPKAEVRGDEDAACDRGGPDAHGKCVYRRVEEDGPASHHEADGGEAG